MDYSILIPIVAVGVGVPGFVAFVSLIAGHTRKMKELAIRERELELGGTNAALGPAVATLSDELNELRGHMTEIQERLDFTERLLASGGRPEPQQDG